MITVNKFYTHENLDLIKIIFYSYESFYYFIIYYRTVFLICREIEMFTGHCSLARMELITAKQCCCSMGAAWGKYCEPCPPKGTGKIN